MAYERKAGKRCGTAPLIILRVPAHAQRNVGPSVDVLERRGDGDGENGRVARFGFAVTEIVHETYGRARHFRGSLLGGVRRVGENGRECANVLQAHDSAGLDGGFMDSRNLVVGLLGYRRICEEVLW